MLPYDTMGLYEQTKPSLMYRVPRVVPDQKGRFESDELFRRLSRESEVRPNQFSISYLPFLFGILYRYGVSVALNCVCVWLL